ncbi:hypothetical protein [Microbacterium telephonicum]|uniref:DNA uptake lipoprotein n=1 Tax=Microbacterium telephonicum TaxID=1714841 RepID=A0A498BUG5_9MICO|nr:hypothetical protein [Microbacterium telephonicum]RLK47534.1 hypothetical protein C7474_2124 [Microbacterium telephonicum]
MTERTDHGSTARMTGIGRVLVVVYAVMALAATGRSFVQIVEDFAAAPVAYTLSAVAALVYILATVALVKADSREWYVVAWVAIAFELLGVLVVGTLSLTHPELFAHDATVWSGYGYGYFWIPLALPCVGLWWLWTHRAGAPEPQPEPVTEGSRW